MRRLVYVSRSLIGADAAALDAIVRQSSARNTAVGVTGMLWFDGANFAQVLEGEHDCINEMMKRIGGDVRHTDLQIVIDREVRGPVFGKWGMIQPDSGPERVASTAFLVRLAMA